MRSSSSRQSWKISRLAMAEVLADGERRRIGLQHCCRSVTPTHLSGFGPPKSLLDVGGRSLFFAFAQTLFPLLVLFLLYSVPRSILRSVSFLLFDIFFLVVKNTSLFHSFAPRTCVFFTLSLDSTSRSLPLRQIFWCSLPLEL